MAPSNHGPPITFGQVKGAPLEHSNLAQQGTGRRLHQAPPPASSLNFTTFRSAADGRCLTVQGGNMTAGGALSMAPCVAGSPAQLFSVPRPGVNMLVYVGNNTRLCVRIAAGGIAAVPCTFEIYSSSWWVDLAGRLMLVDWTRSLDWTNSTMLIERTINANTTNQSFAGLKMQPWVASAVEVVNIKTSSCMTLEDSASVSAPIYYDMCRPAVIAWQRWDFLGDATVRLTSNNSMCMTAVSPTVAELRACNASWTAQAWFRDDIGQLRPFVNGGRGIWPTADSQVSGLVQLNDATIFQANMVWRFNEGAMPPPPSPPPPPPPSPSPPPPPPPPPSPPPPPLPSPPLIRRVVSILGGELKLTGIGAAAAAGGAASQMSSTSSSTAPTAVQLLISGGLQLPGSGMELQLQPGLSLSQRSLAWVYQAGAGTFTTTADLVWNVTAVALSPAAAPSGADPSLECVLTARLQFTSKAYPGPGLSGSYAVTGTLGITPDPWVYFGLAPSGSGTSGSDTVSSPPPPPAAGGRRLTTAHRQLQQGSSLSAQPVTGMMQVSELSPSAASSAADAARGDGQAWVDDKGQVTVAGAGVPANQVPAWKQTGVQSVYKPKTWPPWLYVVVGFGGVTVVNVIVVVCWLLVQRWAARRQAAGQVTSGDAGCVVNTVQELGPATSMKQGSATAMGSSMYAQGGVREPASRALSPSQVSPRMAWEPASMPPPGPSKIKRGRNRH